MSEQTKDVDSVSTTTPLDQERASGRSDTAQSTDKIAIAIDKALNHASKLEGDCRTLKAELDTKAKELKALGVMPGKPITAADLPINRELIEKAINLLEPARMKVKDFQRGMSFFDTGELARVRKVLIAAGVTDEKAEGSVVFISLSERFASEKSPAS